MCFGPGFGGDLGDLAHGHLGQAAEHVAPVGEGIDPAAAAAFHDGVEDRSAFAGVRGSDEQPVLFPDRSGADGVLRTVVVDLDASVGDADLQRGPEVQGVGDGFAKGALGEVSVVDEFECGLDAVQIGFPGRCPRLACSGPLALQAGRA